MNSENVNSPTLVEPDLNFKKDPILELANEFDLVDNPTWNPYTEQNNSSQINLDPKEIASPFFMDMDSVSKELDELLMKELNENPEKLFQEDAQQNPQDSRKTEQNSQEPLDSVSSNSNNELSQAQSPNKKLEENQKLELPNEPNLLDESSNSDIVINTSANQNSPITDKKRTPPEISEKLKKKIEFEKRTFNDIKKLGLLAPVNILIPPTIIPTACVAGLTVISDIEYRINENPEISIASHLKNLISDTSSCIFGESTSKAIVNEKLDHESVELTPQSNTPILQPEKIELSETEKFGVPNPKSKLSIECLKGNEDFIVKYFEGKTEDEIKSIFEKDDEKYALHYAVISGKAELCKKLIKLGAPTNILLEGKTLEKLTKNEIVIATIRAFTILKNELDVLVGMDKIKRNIYQLANKIILDKRRFITSKKINSPIPNAEQGRHMIITGNPGTGKTKVAAIIANLYFALGIIKKNVFIAVQRADLVGEYVGHTAPKTRKVIQKASGGVLFVDEAYRLSSTDNSKDYGPEAIEEIMQHMTDQSPTRTIFIFAGYKSPMERFINTNQGIYRRIDFQLHLEDYDCQDLAEISKRNVYSSHYILGNDIKTSDLAFLIDKYTNPQLRSKMNGGISEKLVQFAIRIQNEQLSLDAGEEELSTLHYNQFETAIQLILHGGDIHQLEESQKDLIEKSYNIDNSVSIQNSNIQNTISIQNNISIQNPNPNNTNEPNPDIEVNIEEQVNNDSLSKNNFDEMIDDLLD